MTPNKIMFIDLETGVREYCGQKASAFNPENYVVMVGQAIDEKPYDGLVTGGRLEPGEDFLKIPDDVWLLVAHNSPFEMSWFLHRQRPEIMKFLKRGGRVFCTAYAHYLLSNQRDTYPALDYIAPMYGGTHKVDGIKLLWEQGYMTEDIDPALLAEYLLGPEGDIENTRKVFYGECQQLQERGMWQMSLERMEGLLSNCFAMDAGLHVDTGVAYARLEEMQQQFDGLAKSFRNARLAMGMPEDCDFKETSDYHMSAWLFGGPVKYKARVPRTDQEGNPIYVKADCYQFGDTLVWADGMSPQQFEKCVLEYGDALRFKAGKNKGKPKVISANTTEVAMKWGELIWQCPGIAPLRTLPKDIRETFEDTYTGKRKLVDGSLVYSTAAEPLASLAAQNLEPAAKQLLTDLQTWARLDKDIGTYYLRREYDAAGNVVKTSGMLQYVGPDGIVHHNLNVTATSTGRLSAGRPNLQNLPRGDSNALYTSQVKEMFTSRFGSKGVIASIDYKALEVVALACFTQDKNLIQALLDGTDMHCLRLSAKLNEAYAAVLKACTDEEHPEHAKYKELRTHIKPPSFAYQYGATARGISFSTGMPLEEAEAFVENEKRLFPGVEAWYSDVVMPTVEGSIKRHREQMEDGTWRLFGTGTWQSPGGTTYEFRQYPKRRWVDGQRLDVMEFKPTQMRNYPIQGESSFFVQGICGLVIRWLIANDFFGGRVVYINTVHDALYFDMHEDLVPIVLPQIVQIMQYLPKYFTEKYGYNLNVPFPAEAEYGPSMAQQQHFKEAA